MKPLDLAVLAAVALAFVLALIFSVRNTKKGCGGSCAECARGRCPRDPRSRD